MARDVTALSLVRERHGTSVPLNEEYKVLNEVRNRFLALALITTSDARRRWQVRAQFMKNQAEDVLDILNRMTDEAVG